MLAERFRRLRPHYSALTRITIARLVIVCTAWSAAMVLSAQIDDSPFDLDHPAIAYSTRQITSVVDALNARVQARTGQPAVTTKRPDISDPSSTR